MARVIILDANVLIGYFDEDDVHHHASVDLVRNRFTEGLATNVLSAAEILVRPTSAHRKDAVLAALANVQVRIIPVDSTQAAPLARVRETYRLRMPDAVALFNAISTGSALATFDDALKWAASRAGITIAI